MDLFNIDTLAQELNKRFGEGFEIEELDDGEGLGIFHEEEGVDLDLVNEEEGPMVAFEVSVVVPRETYESANKEELEAECVDALKELFDSDFGDGYGLSTEGRWVDGWSMDLDPEKDDSNVLFFGLLVMAQTPDLETLGNVIQDILESELVIVSEE